MAGLHAGLPAANRCGGTQVSFGALLLIIWRVYLEMQSLDYVTIDIRDGIGGGLGNIGTRDRTTTGCGIVVTR